MSTDTTETVATYEHDGSTYEIDHLGICRDSQWGEFAVYRDGKQVATFALALAMLRKEFRPRELPVTSAELIDHARVAVADAKRPDEVGEYPCSECGTGGRECLYDLNRSGDRCCGWCGLLSVHSRPADVRTEASR